MLRRAIHRPARINPRDFDRNAAILRDCYELWSCAEGAGNRLDGLFNRVPLGPMGSPGWSPIGTDVNPGSVRDLWVSPTHNSGSLASGGFTFLVRAHKRSGGGLGQQVVYLTDPGDYFATYFSLLTDNEEDDSYVFSARLWIDGAFAGVTPTPNMIWDPDGINDAAFSVTSAGVATMYLNGDAYIEDKGGPPSNFPSALWCLGGGLLSFSSQYPTFSGTIEIAAMYARTMTENEMRSWFRDIYRSGLRSQGSRFSQAVTYQVVADQSLPISMGSVVIAAAAMPTKIRSAIRTDRSIPIDQLRALRLDAAPVAAMLAGVEAQSGMPVAMDGVALVVVDGLLPVWLSGGVDADAVFPAGLAVGVRADGLARAGLLQGLSADGAVPGAMLSGLAVDRAIPAAMAGATAILIDADLQAALMRAVGVDGPFAGWLRAEVRADGVLSAESLARSTADFPVPVAMGGALLIVADGIVPVSIGAAIDADADLFGAMAGGIDADALLHGEALQWAWRDAAVVAGLNFGVRGDLAAPVAMMGEAVIVADADLLITLRQITESSTTMHAAGLEGAILYTELTACTLRGVGSLQGLPISVDSLVIPFVAGNVRVLRVARRKPEWTKIRRH